jgi:hypothetical protein
MVAVRGGAPARKTTQVFGVPSYLTMKKAEKPSILIAVETGRLAAEMRKGQCTQAYVMHSAGAEMKPSRRRIRRSTSSAGRGAFAASSGGHAQM